MENSANVYGMNQGDRAEWAKDLEGVVVVDPGEALTAEYLYWVGCAGSFDDKNKRVTRAVATLLRRAGISVAILGPSEMCCLLYTSPSPRDISGSRMPSSA